MARTGTAVLLTERGFQESAGVGYPRELACDLLEGSRMTSGWRLLFAFRW
jgi:hypothetical protein